MSEISPADPYRSPSLPEGPYVGKPGSSRPQLLSALCIVCIVLGALGLLNAVTGSIGAVAGQQLQKAVQPKMPPNVPQGMQKAQDDFQAEMNDVQSKYFVEMVVSLAFRFMAALLLLIGGIKALGKKESGRLMLLTACAVALIFELGHAILQTVITTEMMTAVNGYLESMLQAMPQRENTKNVKSFMQSFGKVLIYVTIASIYLLMLLKGGVYLFGLIYLRREKVKELFQSA